jgi:hypothetical protein
LGEAKNVNRKTKEPANILGVPGVREGLPEDAPELRRPALLDLYRELREERLKNESKER